MSETPLALPDFPTAALQKARGIKLVVLDVDGVLTGGQLYFGDKGESLKRFNILDGLGIKLLRNNQIETAIITGRSSEIVKRRCEELGINRIIQGREDKLAALDELLLELGITRAQTAYMGDDLPDLAAIRQVALGATVPNCHFLLEQFADWQSTRKGGKGAVRELCDLVLAANGLLEQELQKYV